MSLPLRTASPCIASAMRAASRRLTLLYDEVMAPSGLRVTQFNILSELARRASEPPTVSELAEILTMERWRSGRRCARWKATDWSRSIATHMTAADAPSASRRPAERPWCAGAPIGRRRTPVCALLRRCGRALRIAHDIA